MSNGVKFVDKGHLLLDTTKKSYIKTIIYPNHNPKLSCAG